jgi:isopentenyldiphosphate isomerase
MIVRRVDDRDRPIGAIKRHEVLKVGANFRVVHVLVMNRHGEILLQQIAANHDRHPGWWGSSVAGYVARDESYRGAAMRKLKEELGIAAQPRSLGKTSMIDGASRKFIAVYLLDWDGPLSPNPSDFRALCFAPIDKLDAWQKKLNARFTPTFLHVLRFMREARPRIRN